MVERTGRGVVVSPHPDDAVLSAWSALRSHHPLVCNVCTGAPPAGSVSSFDRLFGVDDSAALVAARVAEDAAALALAGCEVEHLGYLDDQYRTDPLDRSRVRESIERATVDCAWLLAPAGIGGHPDHVVVRDAALRVARDRALPVTLYADLPYAVRFGWPHWVTGLEPRPYLVPDAFWADDLESVPSDGWTLRPTVHRLSDREIAAKQRALECYRTQYAALNGGPFDRVSHPEVIGFEVHWSIEENRDVTADAGTPRRR